MSNRDPHRVRDQERLLSIFSMILLILALLGGFIMGMFEAGLALGFAGICCVLAMILGIMSWRQRLSKFVVIGVGISILVSILVIFFLLVSADGPNVEQKRIEVEEIVEPPSPKVEKDTASGE